MKTFYSSIIVTNKKRKSFIAFLALVIGLSIQTKNATAQDSFTGEIKLVPYNFAPRNWAVCEGQLISISQNAALFALLGTTYGGNGVTNFALPDLRGRVVMGSGSGLGLTPTIQGDTQGSETTTLVLSQMPDHTHPFYVYNGPADTSITSLTANANSIAIPVTPGLTTSYAFSKNPPNAILNAGTIGSVGNTTPVSLKQPSLTLKYIICLYGIFPSRD